MIARHLHRDRAFGMLERGAGILEDRRDFLEDSFPDTRHTLTFEQNPEEIRFLLDVFKDQSTLCFKPGGVRLFCECLDMNQ